MKGGQHTGDWEREDGKRDGKRTESQNKDVKMEKEENTNGKEYVGAKDKTKKTEKQMERQRSNKRGTKS